MIDRNEIANSNYQTEIPRRWFFFTHIAYTLKSYNFKPYILQIPHRKYGISFREVKGGGIICKNGKKNICVNCV